MVNMNFEEVEFELQRRAGVIEKQQAEIDGLEQELLEEGTECAALSVEKAELEQELLDANATTEALGKKCTQLEADREYNAELVREFAILVKETSESVFQSSYRTNFNKYFLMFINKAAMLLEKK